MYSNDRQGRAGQGPDRPRTGARPQRASSNGGADARRRSASGASAAGREGGSFSGSRPQGQDPRRASDQQRSGTRMPASREAGRAAREGGRTTREGSRAARGVSRPARTGAGETPREARRAPKKPRKKWPFVVAGSVVAVVAAIVIAFSCWRWPLSHDAQDIQGVWYIAGTQKTATITADKIELSDDVAYSYELDEGAKTLTLAFGSMTGDARYRFSLDRQELAIRDGVTSSTDSLLEDIPWTLAALGRAIQGDAASPEFSGSQTMVLTRTPQS